MQPSRELLTRPPGGRCRPECNAHEQRQYRDTTEADAPAQSDANAIGPTHRKPRLCASTTVELSTPRAQESTLSRGETARTVWQVWPRGVEAGRRYAHRGPEPPSLIWLPPREASVDRRFRR